MSLSRRAGTPVVCLIASVLGAVLGETNRAAANEIFASDRATSRILAFDAETGAFTRVVSDSALLDEPTGLAFGPGGFLYVANLQSDVLKIDPTTGDATVFASGVTGPGGLAYEPVTNTLFVSEFGQFDGDEVFQYDATGALVRTLGTGSAPTGRTGLAFDDAGNLYVSSFANDAFASGVVLKFDAANDYAPLGVFASGGGLAGASGLDFDQTGNLYVAGLLGQQVVKYTVSGGVVTGGAGLGAPLAYPSGVLADGADVLVTSLGNNNPQDPIYGGLLFPGSIYRFDQATGAARSFLVGDFVRDATVDGADLAAWAAAFGTTAAGDGNGDAISDGADFLAWQRGLGNQGVVGPFQPTGVVRYAPPIAAGVPEPTACCLAAGAAMGLFRLSSRRKRHVVG
jgi:hypothetical protein